MNSQTMKAISYCMNYLAFLFLDNRSKGMIISVYLFGSSVRGEMEKESDIDIFIGCEKENEGLLLKSSEIAERNFRLSKDFEKWKRLDFTYPISIKSGPIKEWQLKTSIDSEGILLFSRALKQENAERIVIFIIDLPKKKNDYLKITRILFGRIEKKFRQKGLVDEIKGGKLGSNTFIVPKEEQSKIIKLLHKNKVSFKMIETARIME